MSNLDDILREEDSDEDNVPRASGTDVDVDNILKGNESNSDEDEFTRAVARTRYSEFVLIPTVSSHSSSLPPQHHLLVVLVILVLLLFPSSFTSAIVSPCVASVNGIQRPCKRRRNCPPE
jgi:hypothetical protein